MEKNLQLATFGGGCFWCTEAVFKEVIGVDFVESGYAGGSQEDPNYQEVSYGNTGHAEVIQIKFDPDKIDYKDILNIFMGTHDPTTLNRQGADQGVQYRSIILYHDAEQKKAAEEVIKELTDKQIFNDPIVTEIKEFTKFYPAEDYHQDYYENNPEQLYCKAVIDPKVAKFRKEYSKFLKK